MSAAFVNGAIAAVSALGVGLMAYLTKLHYAPGGDGAVCDFGAELSCSFVNQSGYSALFGVPISVLGLFYFLAVLVLALRKGQKRRYALIASFTAFSLAFSAYLTYVEIAALGSVCVFCEASKLLMVVVMALMLFGARASHEHLSRAWIVGAVAAGLAFSFGAWMIQREPAARKDYTALARCLTERGAAMYGSYICPACAKQKRLFGAAFSEIAEIECHPRGPDARPELCVAKSIAKTPTWIQERDGRELKRLVGAREPEELAEAFGCPAE